MSERALRETSMNSSSRVNRARVELAQLLSIEGPEDLEEDPITSAVIAGGDRLATEA